MAQSRQEVPIEQEPEYVGVHSGVVTDYCQQWTGEAPETPERCGNRATHTKIMYDGQIHKIGVCDECGEPENLPDREREWSGKRPTNLSADDLDFESMTADDWEAYLKSNDVRLVVRDQEGTHYFVHDQVDGELTLFAYGSLGYSYKGSRAALEAVSEQADGLEVVER